MARKDLDPIVIADTRGGRNGADPPLSLALNQCTEILNMDWKDTTFGRKRGGATAVSQTGGTAFSSGIQTTLRHVPGNAETAAEFWVIDGAATPIVKRLTGGTMWADVTLDDAIASKPQEVVGATLNGKLYLAHDSSVDRLHCYDPSLASARVRRVSFATPGAPTVADDGAGGYAAVLRYYRVRWLQLNGTIVVRRSEPGSSQSFTPSGTGDNATVTRPTAASEGETHWEVEASLDNSTFYRLAQIAIATTTYADDDATTTYANNTLSDVAGTYSRFPSVKYLMSDGNRLLGAHAWESSGADSGGKTSRIWFTPVLGSADKGDDERVPNTSTQKNWVDLNENDGGAITGLGGPLTGVPIAFKYRQVWKLRPTGDVNTPYLPRKMRDDIGCIAHKTICIGEDQYGRAALYFLSHRGPYRVTQDGDIEYLGRDNEDIWRAMNLAATTIAAHATYYPDLHQVWIWIATGSSNDPDVKMMFDVHHGHPDAIGQIRGGWAKHTGDSAGARCSCLFSNTIAASMSRDLKPHIGRSSGTVIGKCDTTDADDFGADFQAYATPRPLVTWTGVLKKHGAGEPMIVAKALASSDVTATFTRDFGLETRSQTVSLAPSAGETRVLVKVAALEWTDCNAIEVTIGDAAANEEKWSIDAVVVPMVHEELR